MWSTEININGPYDFDYVLRRLAMDPLHVVDLDKRIVKVPIYHLIDNEVVEITGKGNVQAPSLIIRGNHEETKVDVLKHLYKLFQWEVTLENIYEHFKKTNLAELFEKQPGTPVVQEFNIYGCLMKCIIHQQLNMAFAHTLSERFVKNFGKEVNGVWFYPRAEEIAELPYDALRDMQYSQRKAEYVIDTSRLIAEGKLDLMALHNMSDEEIMKNLVKVRGIGPWTVQNLMIFGMGRQNLLPKADIGIQNALKAYFHLEKKPSLEAIDEYSKGWEPYASYATLNLWRLIEN